MKWLVVEDFCSLGSPVEILFLVQLCKMSFVLEEFSFQKQQPKNTCAQNENSDLVVMKWKKNEF